MPTTPMPTIDDSLAGQSYADLEMRHAALGAYLRGRAKAVEITAALVALEARLATRAGVIEARAQALAQIEATLKLEANIGEAPSAAIEPSTALPLTTLDAYSRPGVAQPVAALAPDAVPAGNASQAINRPVSQPDPGLRALQQPPKPAAVTPGWMEFVLHHRPGVLFSGGGPLGAFGECNVAQCDPERGVMLAASAPLLGVMLWLSDAETNEEADAVLIAPALYQQQAAFAKVAATSRPELAEAGRVVTLAAGALWLRCGVQEVQADARGVFTALTLIVEAGVGAVPGDAALRIAQALDAPRPGAASVMTLTDADPLPEMAAVAPAPDAEPEATAANEWA